MGRTLNINGGNLSGHVSLDSLRAISKMGPKKSIAANLYAFLLLTDVPT